METKIDFNKLSDLILKENSGKSRDELWENTQKYKSMEIKLKDELDTLIRNPLTKEISYKDNKSYMKKSLMYKIIENQEIFSKEEFLSLYKEEGGIFEQTVEKIDFDKFKNIKTILINCIASNDETLVNFYSNGFFDDLSKFNEETEVHLSNVILKNVDKVFLNLIYQ